MNTDQKKLEINPAYQIHSYNNSYNSIHDVNKLFNLLDHNIILLKIYTMFLPKKTPELFNIFYEQGGGFNFEIEL